MSYGFDYGFGGGFDFFSIIFTVIFLLIIGVFILGLVQSFSQWNKNNNSPRLTVPASIIAKRQHTSHHHHAGTNNHSHTSTSYYVTFQVESGDRMELRVPSDEYGMLVEGDYGQLSFQGTRYLGFEREF